MVETYLLTCVFLFGIIIGSFLNVLILRHGTGRSAVSDRSACFSCGSTLRWYELIPLVSFLVQRGRCRSCKAPISFQYPVVELATGILFVLGTRHIMSDMVQNATTFGQASVLALLLFVIMSLLIMMTVYDMRHTIIPDAWVYPFAGSAFLYAALTQYFSFGTLSVWSVEDMCAGIILAIPFTAIWFFSKGRAMGLADAKLALGIGSLLGLSGGLAALMIAFWIGAIVGVLLIVMHRYRALFRVSKRFTIKSEIPFGPFLALGTVLVYFLNIRPWEWFIML